MVTKLFKKAFDEKKIFPFKRLGFKCDVSNTLYPVTVNKTARKNTISIKVDKNKILVNSPHFIKENFIFNLLEKKKKWISKSLLRSNYEVNSNFACRKAFYLGKKYKINIKKGLQSKIILNKGSLELIFSRKNLKIKRILENWYKKKCYELLDQRINYFAKKINVKYKEVFIRSYIKRLGSCDTKKRISFNWKLILMPTDVIDYVVIHELCHLIHFNHSKLFWEEVSLYCPKYKYHKNWIEENLSILNF